MTPSRIELRILGHTELSTVGNLTGGVVLRQPKRLSLLAYLALAASDGFRRRDQIVALFWPEQDQFHARTQLRKVLYALRGVLGSEAFITRGEGEIRLNTDLVWCDAVAFRRCCETREWTEALTLYRGDLLDGLFPGGVDQEFESWLQEQRASLRDQASRVAWECSSRADLSGKREEAIALAKRAIDLHPDDEQSIRRLIAALDRYGDRAGALRVFSEWQARLQSEFGAEPAPETRKLVRKVQAQRKGESTETPNILRAIPQPSTDAVQQQVVSQPTPAVSQPIHLSRRLITTAALSGVVLVLAAFAVTARFGASAVPAVVAVLPFRGLGDSRTTLIGEGIAEELTTTLAQVTGLSVRSSARSREALSDAKDVADIGRKLAVEHILDGSVIRDSKRLHVTVRLVRVSDGLTLWARAFDESSTDLITSQEHIAKVTVAELSPLLTSRPIP